MTTATFDSGLLGSGLSLSNGDLTVTGSTNFNRIALGTGAKTSGKYYFEVVINNDRTGAGAEAVGISPDDSNLEVLLGSDADGYAFLDTGSKRNNNASVGYGSSFSDNDVIGVAVDLDNGIIWFSINDTWQNGASITEVQNSTATNAAYSFTVTGPYLIAVNVVGDSGGSDDGEATLRTASGSFTGTQPTGYDEWTNPVTADGTVPITPEVAGDATVSPIHADGAVSITPSAAGTAESTTKRADGSVPVSVAASGTGTLSPIHADGGIAVTPAVSGTTSGRISADGAVSITPSVAGTGVTVTTGSIDAALGELGSSIDGVVTTDAAINAQIPGPESAIAGEIGVAGTIGGELGELESEIDGQAEYVGSINGALGVLGASISGFVSVTGSIDADLGVIGAYIVGDVGVSATYRVVVMNLKNFAITEYESVEFNSMIEWNGTFYGADANGIFTLSGDTDAGTEIAARYRTGIMDHGTDITKRVSDIYVSGKSTKDILFSLLLDEANEKYDYRVPMDATAFYNAYKANVGRGARARFFQYEVANVDGADMEVDDISLMVQEIERRRKR